MRKVKVEKVVDAGKNRNTTNTIKVHYCILFLHSNRTSVAEPEPMEPPPFRAAPEPIFLLVGAGSRNCIF